MANQADINSIKKKNWWRKPNPERDWIFASDAKKLFSDIPAKPEEIQGYTKSVQPEWAAKWGKDLFGIVGEGQDPKPFEFGKSGDKTMDDFIDEKKFKWIPYKDFKDVKEIGGGGFGVVYKATWNEKKVALKCPNTNDWKVFLQEWNSHATFLYSHEIVNVIGFTKDLAKKDNSYMAIMAFANEGTLKDNLEEICKSDWKQKLYILYKIISGLNEIHENNFVHRDIHDSNILINKVNNNGGNKFTVDAKDDICICDLGICQAIESPYDDSKIYGNLRYMAPETFKGNRSKSNDIYSFSMIMWELTSGVQPFNNYSNVNSLILDVIEGKRPMIIENTPKCYENLMKLCWDGDHEKRPSAHEVLVYIMNWIFFQPDGEEITPKVISDIKEFIDAGETQQQTPNNAPQAPNNAPQAPNNAPPPSKSCLISLPSNKSNDAFSTGELDYIVFEEHDLE